MANVLEALASECKAAGYNGQLLVLLDPEGAIRQSWQIDGYDLNLGDIEFMHALRDAVGQGDENSYVNADGVPLALEAGEDPDEEFKCGHCGEAVTLRTGVSSEGGTVHPGCREEMEQDEPEDDEGTLELELVELLCPQCGGNEIVVNDAAGVAFCHGKGCGYSGDPDGFRQPVKE